MECDDLFCPIEAQSGATNAIRKFVGDSIEFFEDVLNIGVTNADTGVCYANLCMGFCLCKRDGDFAARFSLFTGVIYKILKNHSYARFVDVNIRYFIRLYDRDMLMPTFKNFMKALGNFLYDFR